MHIEILSKEQIEMLPFISQFKRSFYLVGGTAIALQIGHRMSIDFDLFTTKKLNKSRIKQKVYEASFSKKMRFEYDDQIHFYINSVNTTFFIYPYPVEHPIMLEKTISMPTLVSLAAMKAFALGHRAKWKDYVDLYFMLKDHFSIAEISTEANKIFGELFSEHLFRRQLAYHKNMDFSEEVAYLPGFEVDEKEVKEFLIDKALQEI
jgi:hypothetical protein